MNIRARVVATLATSYRLTRGRVGRHGRGSALLWLLVLLPGAVLASNTGGVFGPVVNEGHRSMQYRAAEADGDLFAQRLHVQAASSDNLMWRVVAQNREADFDYLQGELFWQLSNLQDRWSHGLRIDLRYRDADRPHQLGLNWMHEVRWSDRWSARGLLLTTVQFGSERRSGVGVQLRGSVTRKMQADQSLSLSWFSDYGTTAQWRSGRRQLHELGPTYQVKLGQDWSLLGGALFGLTDAASDTTFRIWLTRSF